MFGKSGWNFISHLLKETAVESIGGEHSELIDEMQGAINADKLERTVFESIQQKVLGL